MKHFLVGQRLSLHALRAEDVDNQSSYASWLNDLELDHHTERNFFPHSVEMLKEYVSQANASRETLLLGIYENESGAHIGNIALQNIDFQHRCAEVAYLIGERSSWGKGYATEAVCMVLYFGFTKLSLERIEAGSNAENVGSVRVLEKAGLLREGVQRGRLLLNRTRKDIILFGALADEWMSEFGAEAKGLFMKAPVSE